MAVEGDYPLLILPTGTLLPPIQRAAFGDGARNPTKARQLERLGPAFLELQKALERQSALLSETATGYGPEHVLVFETNGPAKALLDVISGTPDLEWLIEHDERVAQDEDYKIERKPDKELNATLYMVMFNQVALEQLLSAWSSYSSNKRLPKQLRGWLDVFRCLRAVRRWGPEDRLREAGLLSDVLMPIDPNRHIPVEIELWPRAGERRQRAEQLVRTLVDAADGRVLHTCSITEIRYHALLVELPSRYLLRLLEVKDVELLQADDIYLIRPTAQAVVPVEEPFETEERRATSASVEGEPICALLDGLPMENHPLLQNRLLVDDPDFLASTYPVTHRRHGTAMASLIIHGDQHEQQPSLDRPIYVRPILALDHGEEERAPRSRLWVDLIHQAVRRIVAEDVPNGPVAPSVKLINLSVGDAGRPFLHEPSPLARLLDWLSWKHQILFMVSAGNHRDDLPPECRDDIQALRHVFEQRRHRSLLSPAELINGITVGASNEDGCKALINPGQQAIPQRPSSPAVYSALGRGMKRSVKPDVLAPGGRLLYQPRIPIGNANWTVSKRQTLGHLVATPGPPGATRLATLTGTSNAAALATRTACIAYESVQQARSNDRAEHLSGVPDALLLKALVVHSAHWPQEMHAFVLRALNGLLHAKRAKDDLSCLLGYGILRPELVLGCNPNRATAIGGGSITLGTRIEHRFPVPEVMHLHSKWRRLTATLAWFSPINPGHRKYRAAKLFLSIPKGNKNPFTVDGGQVHGQTATRGTVQHIVMEELTSVMNVGSKDELELVVECAEDAGPLKLPIPYALAISVEVNTDELALYDSVAARLRVPIAVPVRTRA